MRLFLTLTIILALIFPALADDFESKFAPLQKTLRDPEARFSGSEMFQSLEALVPLVNSGSKEAGALYYELCQLQGKRHEFADCLKYGKLCAEAEESESFLTEKERFYLFHSMYLAASATRDYPLALEHLDRAISYQDALSLKRDQKLGLRSDRGFLLHESKKYEEALEANLAVLRDTENSYGKRSLKLAIPLRNIAQNYYELERFDEAESVLMRRLKLGETMREFEIEFDSRFQLGVLQFEQGNNEAAAAAFELNLEKAKKQREPQWAKAAEEHLKAYQARLAK